MSLSLVLPTITIPEHAPLAEPIPIPAPPERPWRIADLYLLADDERRFELVHGELLMMRPASPVQGRYAERLARAMGQFVEDHDLGEVYVSEPGFVLKPEPDAVVRAPDVAFVRLANIPPEEQQLGFWNVAPDIAVEIISPSETSEMIEEKVRNYLDAGTGLVWLVYPRLRTVTEHRPDRVRTYATHESLEGGDVLPGFSYPLQKLFRTR